MRRWLLAGAGAWFGVFAGAAAWADCQDDVAALQPQVETAAAGRTKQLLTFDLKRARQELAEGDQDECQAAVDHARRLLHGED